MKSVNSERIFRIQKFFGLHESEDGGTQLRMGEAVVQENWQLTENAHHCIRPGYRVLHAFDAPVRGLWTGYGAGRETTVCAADGGVWELTEDSARKIGDIADSPVSFFGFNGKLYMLNGSEYLYWDGDGYVDVVEGYVPLVFTSMLPSGSRTAVENINRLTGKRRVRYSANGESTEYHLPEQTLASIDKVYVDGILATGTTNALMKTPQLFTDEAVNTDSIDAFNQEMTKDMSYLGRMAYHAGNSIGGMLPSIGASIVTGNPVVGAGMMGLSSGGSAMNEMLKQGYSAGQARTYGALVGASEALMQYFLGGISKLSGGKGLGQAALKNLSHIDNALVRYIGTMGLNIAKEIGEEELQLFLEPLIKAAVTGEEYDAPTWQAMLETAISTAISTGVLEVGNTTAYSPNAANTKTSEQVSSEAVGMTMGQANKENADSTAINTDPAKHTPVEQAVIDEYQGAVDEDLRSFYQKVNVENQKGSYELKPVSNRAADAIQAILKKDVHGFKTQFEARQMYHTQRRHGKNGKADHSMKDANDIARIQYVLDNYDSVSDGGTTSAYWEKSESGKNKQARTVVFKKAVNGTYYVVEAAPITKANSVYVVTAYMSKKGQKNKAVPDLLDADATAPQQRPITSNRDTALQEGSPSNSKLAQPQEIVNPETALDPVAATFRQAQEQQNAAKEAIAQAQNGVSADESVGAAPQGFSTFGQYGFMPPGKNASRIVNIPVSVDGETKVSQHGRTIAEAEITTDETARVVEELIEEGALSNAELTDRQAISTAEATVTAADIMCEGTIVVTAARRKMAAVIAEAIPVMATDRRTKQRKRSKN